MAALKRILFSGTIFENISYARPGATRDEIIDSAMAANAHEFIIRKPDGYDTIVGERGSRLSGGEKQRIAIARALLKDPRSLSSTRPRRPWTPRPRRRSRKPLRC